MPSSPKAAKLDKGSHADLIIDAEELTVTNSVESMLGKLRQPIEPVENSIGKLRQPIEPTKDMVGKIRQPIEPKP